MKNKFIFFVIIVLSATLTSCSFMRVPISVTEPENNKTYEVEYLFEHDGCKVYRFRDYGNYVYFTNCNNSVTSVVNDSLQIKTLTNMDFEKR